MTVGELIVKIAVKGGDVASKSLGEVKKGMKSIVGSSLEAKAAVLGVIYAVERLVSSNAAHGASLTQFNLLTGESTQWLQKWDLAARKAGASSGAMESSLKQLQIMVGQVGLGIGAPSGLQLFGTTTGFDLNKLEDLRYVAQKVREFANSPVTKSSKGNVLLRSILPNESIIAAFRSAYFKPSAVKDTDILNAKQIARLTDINAKWVGFINTLSMFGSHFTVQFGPPLISLLTTILDLFIKLDSVIEKFLPKIKKLADIKLNMSAPNEPRLSNEKKRSPTSDDFANIPSVWEIFKAMINFKSTPTSDVANWQSAPALWGIIKTLRDFDLSPQTINHNVSTTVHNHGVEGMHEGAHHVETAVSRAYRQSPVLNHGP